MAAIDRRPQGVVTTESAENTENPDSLFVFFVVGGSRPIASRAPGGLRTAGERPRPRRIRSPSRSRSRERPREQLDMDALLMRAT